MYTIQRIYKMIPKKCKAAVRSEKYCICIFQERIESIELCMNCTVYAVFELFPVDYHGPGKVSYV